MSSITPQSNKTKYIIIVVGLALAGLGYLGYRSLLVKPEINVVNEGRRGGRENSQGAGFRWGGEQNTNTTSEKVTKPKDTTNTESQSGSRKSRRKGND